MEVREAHCLGQGLARLDGSSDRRQSRETWPA